MTAAHDETRNILEESPLHKVMVFYDRAEIIPAAPFVAGQMASALLIGWLWHAAGAPPATALLAGATLGLATIADVLLLRRLPQAGISFGPWKSQTAVLLTPRALIAASAMFLSGLTGWPAALGLHIALQASGSLLLWWAAAIEPARLALTRLEVQTAAWPPGSEPLKILHISDIHLERYAGREQRLLQLAHDCRPHLIAITGDYLNLSYNRDELAKKQLAALLAELHAPLGVFATLGSPPVDLREEIVPLLEALPLALLRDEWRTVRPGQQQELTLLGVDCTHHLDIDAPKLEQLASAAPGGAPRLLLYHSPELMPQAVANGIDLYLCGHTHGGQVRLPLVGALLTSSRLGRRYVMGLYREGQTHLYISRGVGLEGLSAPRVRLLAPPEITLVILSPAP